MFRGLFPVFIFCFCSSSYGLTCSEAFQSGSITQHSLLGKESIDPKDPLLTYLVSSIRRLQNGRQFPQVAWGDIKAPTHITTNGRGNDGLQKGVYGSRQVIIKSYNEATRFGDQGLLNEAKVLMELNKFNLGLEFFGLTETPSGKWALVLEFIDGASISLNKESHRQASQVVEITEKTLNDVARTGQVLAFLGYRITLDTQYMIGKDGRALLMDPEFFYLKAPRQLPIPDLNLPSNPIDASQFLINSLRPLVKSGSSLKPKIVKITN